MNKVGDWRGKLWAAAKDGPLAAPLAVSLCCGCRPLELAHGVSVELDGDGSIRLHTEGVKLKRGDPKKPRENSGQEWRSVWVAPDAPESRFLRGLAKRNGGSVVVRYDAPGDMPTVAAKWGIEVRKLAKEAFPKLASKVTVNPYVLRHAFSASLKAQVNHLESLTEAERASIISEALGHLSARTADRYGTQAQSRGKSKGPTVIRTSAPSAVRNVRAGNPRRHAARAGGPKTR